MKYTFKSKTGLIEKTGLISKSGLIEGFVDIQGYVEIGTTTGGIGREFEI